MVFREEFTLLLPWSSGGSGDSRLLFVRGLAGVQPRNQPNKGTALKETTIDVCLTS